MELPHPGDEMRRSELQFNWSSGLCLRRRWSLFLRSSLRFFLRLFFWLLLRSILGGFLRLFLGSCFGLDGNDFDFENQRGIWADRRAGSAAAAVPAIRRNEH